jgi:hypothetical protein
VIAAGFCSVEQRKGPQSPAPSSALHPRSPDQQARNDFAELDMHDYSAGDTIHFLLPNP